jgi:hypothetical protein
MENFVIQDDPAFIKNYNGIYCQDMKFSGAK